VSVFGKRTFKNTYVQFDKIGYTTLRDKIMLTNRMRGNSSAMIKENECEICAVYLDPECGIVLH
jgi:hypothetical protein